MAYVVDDNTATMAGTTDNLLAGYVVEVPSASRVRVRIERKSF